MATNPKKSTKKKELEEAWVETSELVTTLGDCLMDVFDEHDIKYQRSDSYPSWNYVFNSRHSGYFSSRETGILISNIYLGIERGSTNENWLIREKEECISSSIIKLKKTIKGMIDKDINIRSTHGIGREIFISIQR